MQDVCVIATASILPETIVSNRDIGRRLIDGAHARNIHDAEAEDTVRTRAELIEQKTGLRARRFFAPDDTPVEIGMNLLEKLMGEREWAALDAIIVSSSSVQGFPGISQQIVAALREKHGGLAHPFVLDISSNACTSFMYAMTVGRSLIQAMGYRKVACLAIEFSSRCIAYDPKAFGISTLFGDAAAGVLLTSGVPGLAAVRASRADQRQRHAGQQPSGRSAARCALVYGGAAGGRWGNADFGRGDQTAPGRGLFDRLAHSAPGQSDADINSGLQIGGD